MTDTPTPSAYDQLLQRLREAAALEQAAHLLRWDQETMMPRRGASARAEELAALDTVVHEKRTSPDLKTLLEDATAKQDDPIAQANLREARRQISRAERMPVHLVAELARVTSEAQGCWASAKNKKRFSEFAPVLERLVELKRAQADALGYDDTPYNALLDEFEPGATVAAIAPLFHRLRPQLTSLLERIMGSRRQQTDIGGPFSEAAQMRVAREVAVQMGYDFEAGRLDLSVHPFTSGGVPGDVRITTRVDLSTFEDCLYSTMHEVGHALYEQGIDPQLELQPAGESVSMGVHESQSRLWENQIGRGRPFMTWLFPRLRQAFDCLQPQSPEALYSAVNRVAPSFIRTESDEVTYNLHVILRFEIERALIEEGMPVKDLPEAWNAKMQAYLGITPPNDALGVLQDVHWAAGAFGYFPTYTLGNLYSAELFAAATDALGDVDVQLERGELLPMRHWLRQHVHRYGKVYDAQQLIANAVGHAPTEGPFLTYLSNKYGEIYDI